jgi:nucleoside-diphosphate-sugar epimerase
VSGVLVTGATGFVGRGTLLRLVASGMEVHAITSRTPGPAGPAGVHWHHADLHDPRSTEAVLGEVAVTHLLHLAWYAEPGTFWTSSENLRWVEASLRLLRAFTANGGQRAVLAGTCAEYAWEDRVQCVEGKTPCRPATLYGASKHALHLVAERFAWQIGLSLAWGRIFFVFGPHEHPARLGGSVARALVMDEPAPCSHGRQVRDFLYSEDLADAFVALLLSSVDGAVNVASGRPVPIRRLVEALASAAGRPELVQFGARPANLNEPTELVADVTRLREEVGWTPPKSLEERAADTIAWWRSELTDAAQRPAPA